MNVKLQTDVKDDRKCSGDGKIEKDLCAQVGSGLEAV